MTACSGMIPWASRAGSIALPWSTTRSPVGSATFSTNVPPPARFIVRSTHVWVWRIRPDGSLDATTTVSPLVLGGGGTDGFWVRGLVGVGSGNFFVLWWVLTL